MATISVDSASYFYRLDYIFQTLDILMQSSYAFLNIIISGPYISMGLYIEVLSRI